MATDLRIAATTAKLGVSFTRLGLSSGLGASFFLPKLVGPQNATEMLLTGRLMSGVEAFEKQLVLQAVPPLPPTEPCSVFQASLSLAEQIALSAPKAVRITLHSIRESLSLGLSEALTREADGQSRTFPT